MPKFNNQLIENIFSNLNRITINEGKKYGKLTEELPSTLRLNIKSNQTQGIPETPKTTNPIIFNSNLLEQENPPDTPKSNIAQNKEEKEVGLPQSGGVLDDSMNVKILFDECDNLNSVIIR